MKDIPKEIYLTVGDIGEDVAKECSFNDLAKEEICWCEDKIDDYDIKYVLDESLPHERVVTLPPLICNKCNKDMKFWDGHTAGAYGTDIENCDDPQYLCKCGNKIYINTGAR